MRYKFNGKIEFFTIQYTGKGSKGVFLPTLSPFGFSWAIHLVNGFLYNKHLPAKPGMLFIYTKNQMDKFLPI